MKTTFISLIFMIMTAYAFAQDTMQVNTKKKYFSIQAGVYYKTFFNKIYIEPTPYNYGDEFSKHQYERFTVVPTFGYSIGLLFTYKFDKHLEFTSGLLYFLRKDVFEKNQDTAIKYGNGSAIRDINNVLKYDYSYNNFEIPILLQYCTKKITLYHGCNLSLISYKNAAYEYLINQYPNLPKWTTSNKTIAGWELPLKIFPTFQTSYEFQIKKIKFNPYAAIYYAVKDQNDFYIQLGINVPLLKKH